MRTLKKLLVLLFTLSISACSTMQPPRYAVSIHNVESLKELENAQFYVSELDQSAEFKSTCRLIGFIEPADGLTMSEFITKAFNDEARMANVYSKDGVSISGNVNKIVFSSVKGVTNGYWDIGITLYSTNGESMTVDNIYNFKSGFDAITACNATADALSPAVQDLISKTINDPRFFQLLN